MKALKLSTPAGAPPHVADIVNQMNRILGQQQNQADSLAAKLTKAVDQIQSVNTTLQTLTGAGLTPDAVAALISSITGQ